MSQIDANKLQQIKLKLSKHAIKEISKRSGCHVQTVYDVFKGKSNNMKILAAIVQVYEEEQAVHDNLRKATA